VEETLRKVAYCAAGTVVAFPIPQAFYDDHLARSPVAELQDVAAPCAVLERVVTAVRGGAAPRTGEPELEAACILWRFFNESGGFADDIVVIDHVGDGRSVEFSPLSEAACGLASASCPCLQSAIVAEPLPA
jgi:hypothetical protein